MEMVKIIERSLEFKQYKKYLSIFSSTPILKDVLLYELVKVIERSLKFNHYTIAMEDAFNNVTTLTIRTVKFYSPKLQNT